jgi:hypothetical protein
MALEQTIHRQATRLSTPEIVGALQSVLGQRLVAVIAGVSDAKAVTKWARGGRSPHPDSEKHLRDAYQIVQLLLERESSETVRAWFVGMNPDLDDQAPALVLCKDPVGVLHAAREFLANG